MEDVSEDALERRDRYRILNNHRLLNEVVANIIAIVFAGTTVLENDLM